MHNGNDNTWKLGTCSSSKTYESLKEYSEQCCLTPGTYTLECQDSYGDGWNGGFIEIQGSNYCKGFLDGSSENAIITIEGGDDFAGRYRNLISISCIKQISIMKILH